MQVNINIKYILENKLGYVIAYSVLYIGFSKNQKL